MIFSVEVTETLARTITIDATTQDEALDKAKNLYRDSAIILDSSDFIDVGFNTKATD